MLSDTLSVQSLVEAWPVGVGFKNTGDLQRIDQEQQRSQHRLRSTNARPGGFHGTRPRLDKLEHW